MYSLYSFQKFENLKQGARHSELVKSTHYIFPEKSGSENFTQNLQDWMSNTASPQCLQFINKISLIILAVANQIALPQVSQHFVSNVMDALDFNGSEKKPALIVSSLLLASL